MKEGKRLSEDAHCAATDVPQAGLPRVEFDEFAGTGYDEWKEAAIAALKGAPFEKSMFTQTYEGIKLEPVYTIDHTRDLPSPKSFPGQSDALRGARASGYLSRPWEIAQECDAISPALANDWLKRDLERGATTIALNLDPNLVKESADLHVPVFRRGVAVSSLSDLETVLEGVCVTKHEFHVHAGASSAASLALFCEVAKGRGSKPASLTGCIGADPIGSYLKNGSLPCDLDQFFDEMAHTIYFARENAPRLRTVLLDASVYHNGGANAVQEVAYVMADAIETMNAMRFRHLEMNDFARHVRFEFSIGSNFFMEIAKLRAARMVWARIVEAFGGDEEARKANIFGRTSFFTKTVYDPYVNMLRSTTEAFSAVVGGVDGLSVSCFDEAIRMGDEFSRRVARNSQIMLQEEYSLLQPVDPAGGSWYLETLTDTLARKIWETIQEVEREGGMLSSVRAGSVQSAVADVLAQRFKKLASRSDRAVGTNMYPNMMEQPLPPHAFDVDSFNAERAGSLETLYASRDAERVKEGLRALVENSLAGGALIGLIAAVASEGATLEEIRTALNDDAKPEAEITPISVHRWTEQYEKMRQTTERYKERTGDNVRIFLANMGPIPQHKARADFITGFMEVAGFEVLKNNGFPTVEECAEASAESGADIAVICSTDATYPELVPPLARLIKEKCPKQRVFLAGAPPEELKETYLEAGVDDFVNIRSNCLAVLTDLQKRKGMF